MTWLIYVSISIASIAIANIFQRIAMVKKDSDPIVSAIVFQFLATIVTFIFTFFKGFYLPSVNLLPYFIIPSVFYAFGTLFIFKAIKRIEASEASIISGIGSLATIISAFLFLNERLRIIQIAGVFLIILAIFLVNRIKGKVKLDRGLMLALIGNSFYGLAVTGDTFILRSYDAVSYTPVIFLLPGIILCIIYYSKLKKIVSNIKEGFDLNLIIYSVLYGIQAVTYFLAIENGALASQISTVFKIEIVLTVILGAVFLKERKYLPLKLIALILALGGAYLTAV